MIRTWHVKDGSLHKQIKGFAEPAVCLAFSPDGTTLTSAHDKAIKFWNLATGQEKASVPWLEKLDPQLQRLEYSKDGKTLIARHSPVLQGLKIFDALSFKERDILPADIGGPNASLSPDGKIVALFSAAAWPEVRLFEMASGKELPRLKANSVNSVVWSADGKRLATTGNNGWVILWDTVLFNKIAEWEYPGPVMSATFDPTGRYLLTGNGNGTVYILRLPEQTAKSAGLDRQRVSARFAPAHAAHVQPLVDHVFAGRFHGATPNLPAPPQVLWVVHARHVIAEVGQRLVVLGLGRRVQHAAVQLFQVGEQRVPPACLSL